ncbi:MAG: DUF6058 family natural product biosynthesis protein [Pseudomonadota bacterium]
MPTINLFKYLSSNFLTFDELIKISSSSQELIEDLIDKKKMPKASYTLHLNSQCHSFFGENHTQESILFFAKGYTYWLGLLQNKTFDAKQYFKQEYIHELSELEKIFGAIEMEKYSVSLNAHLEQEWEHFLAGIYGLCTRSGLPREIARKEYAIDKIKKLTDDGKQLVLNTGDKQELSRAIKLLDEVSALFAHHEIDKSSREKYINVMRKQYGLAG